MLGLATAFRPSASKGILHTTYACVLCKISHSPVIELSVTLSCMRRLSSVRLLTAGRVSPGRLSRKRHRAECLVYFAMLDALNGLSIKTMYARCLYTIYPIVTRVHSAFRPSALARKGILHISKMPE